MQGQQISVCSTWVVNFCLSSSNLYVEIVYLKQPFAANLIRFRPLSFALSIQGCKQLTPTLTFYTITYLSDFYRSVMTLIHILGSSLKWEKLISQYVT